MSEQNLHKWNQWLSELQSISQIGLAYSKDPYDLERFKQLKRLSAELAANMTDIEQAKIEALFDKETGYATPKLDLRAAIFKDDQVLLVRERRDQVWSLPGGWADMNDSPSSGIIREVKEETGFDANVLKLIALFDKQKQGHPPHFPHTYKAFFLCEITGGEMQENMEIDKITYFPVNNLPNLCPHRVLAKQIELCYKHYQQPDLATEYD